MNKPNKEIEKGFSQEQYAILLRCSKSKDAQEWNTWRNENFESAIQLEGANFKGAYLCGLDLSGANLKKADLSEACFWNSNLNNADLRSSTLIATTINEADLTTINLSHANCKNANFSKSNLWVANLSKANFSGANLREVNLWEANLHGANLKEADLWFAELFGADMRETLLDNANLGGARLASAKLDRAHLTGIKTYAWDITDWTIRGVHCDFLFPGYNGVTKYPRERNFEPGEFEKYYRPYPTLLINFKSPIKVLDGAIVLSLIEKINGENRKTRHLHLESIDNKGLYPCITIIVKQWDEKESARDIVIKKIYETRKDRTLIDNTIFQNPSESSSIFLHQHYTLSKEDDSVINVEILH